MRYRLVYTASFIALLAERLWNHFFAAISVAALFIGLCLLNLPQMAGPEGQALVILSFLAAVLFAAGFYGRGFRIPGRNAVERKIEAESGYRHRPLETLRDAPVTDSPLWPPHAAAAADLRDRAKPYRPRSDVPQKDPHALRLLALAVLIAGLIVAGHDAPQRLSANARPDIAALLGMQQGTMDAWLTPPDYTHAAPVLLAAEKTGARAGKNVSVPSGSLLKLRLGGFRFSPRVEFDGRAQRLSSAGRSHTLDMKIGEAGTLDISYFGFPVARWHIDARPDEKPTAEILAVTPTAQGALKILYKTDDDYGVTNIDATVVPDGGADILFAIHAAASKDPQSHTEDLTGEDMAGLPAKITITATDAAGQRVTSAPMDITLPERVFTNPVAAKLVQERKRLTFFNSPLSYVITGNTIVDIANHPGYYRGDPRIFLVLAVAAKRLAHDESPASVDSVKSMLWQLAIAIEDGGLSSATKDLADALQKMQDMLADKNTTEAQMRQMMAEVQQKMQEYLGALAQELQQRMALDPDMKMPSPELAAKFMQRIDMKKLIEQMQQLLAGGSREDMQKMAERLGSMIRGLDMSKFSKLKDAQQQAMQSLHALEELIKAEKSLQTRTQKKKDGQDVSAETADQEKLRKDLGEIVRKVAELAPEIPENFAVADQAMKAAADALSIKKPGIAAPAQGDAIKALEDGLQSAADQMAQGLQQMMVMMGLAPGAPQMGGNYDPLGREGGTATGGDMKLPDEKERRRVQEIIEELRKRSNEQTRPKVERDYIDRLLNTFN